MQGIFDRNLKSLPHEVYLNPYYDSFTTKMEDLFEQFLAEDERMAQLKGLLEKASKNELHPADHPSPNQQDNIASFSSLNRSMINPPPVMRRKQTSFTRTLGPISQSVYETPRKETIASKPSLINTLRSEDRQGPDKLVSLELLLREVTTQSDDSFNAKELILANLLNLAEGAQKSSSQNLSKDQKAGIKFSEEQLRIILKDIIELPIFLSGSLARRIGEIIRGDEQGKAVGLFQGQHLKEEQVRESLRSSSKGRQCSSQKGGFHGGSHRARPRPRRLPNAQRHR
jgi:hypothetical protein